METRSAKKRKTEAPPQKPKFYKILNYNFYHHDMTYADGLNVYKATPDKPYNDKQCENGLHFFTEAQLFNEHFVHIFQPRERAWLAEIEIPEDAKWYNFGTKCKTDKLIIKSTSPFWDHPRLSRLAVENDPALLRFVNNPTDDLLEYAVRESRRAPFWIKDGDLNSIVKVLRLDPQAINQLSSVNRFLVAKKFLVLLEKNK